MIDVDPRGQHCKAPDVFLPLSLGYPVLRDVLDSGRHEVHPSRKLEPIFYPVIVTKFSLPHPRYLGSHWAHVHVS